MFSISSVCNYFFAIIIQFDTMNYCYSVQNALSVGLFMKMFQLLVCLFVAGGVENVCASEVGSPSSKSYRKTVNSLKTVHRLCLIAESQDGRQSPSDSIYDCNDSFSPKADRYKKVKAGKRKDNQKLALSNS